MHIAMLIGSLTKGGAERVMVNLADFLIRAGHRVTVVTQYKKENEYPLHEEAVRVISDITPAETTKNPLINLGRRFRKLRKIWKTSRPDVILSFIGKNNMMAVLTSRFLPLSVAVSVRADFMVENYATWMRWAARWLYRLADGVILQTEENGRYFPAAVRKKVKVLRNLINPVFFRPRFTGERDKTIVAVGRVDDNKNHRMLIQAFSRITGEFPDYQVVIYGEGELREPLLREVQEMGLSEKILLPGKSSNIESKIYRAGIFVLTSDTEGYPNALLEAMLSGLPVIATNCSCGGPAELIDHGKNGLLTSVRDTEELTKNLCYLLRNPQLADCMGREAVGLQEIFNPDKTGKAWEDYLKSLI